MKRTSYHHGNLRQALLDAGLELLAERGVDGFTLREVARRAGVSHAAPYHHFSDRGALVGAIVAASFELLGSSLADASAISGADPLDRLGAMGRTYVDFALDHPQRYRLMFRSDLSRSGDSEAATDADAAGGRAFATLMSAVQEAADRGLLREVPTPGPRRSRHGHRSMGWPPSCWRGRSGSGRSIGSARARWRATSWGSSSKGCVADGEPALTHVNQRGRAP